MSYIQPDSEIWLCSGVPLDPSYDNQLTFTSGTGASRIWDSNKQKAYFASKAVSHPQNYSIVKERDGVLRLAGDVGDFYGINYMFFTNSNFSNKLFYAFVTKVEYLNPNTTLMYFELDEFQTWAENLEFKESSIEREHVEHDEMYANLEDEGMPISERIPYAVEYFDGCLGEKQLVIGATESKFDVEAKLQREGIEIDYNYLNFAPNLGHTATHFYEVTQIKALKCYNSNNDLIPYGSFYYDTTTKKIRINGLSDVNITKIYFRIIMKYHYTHGALNTPYTASNLEMEMVGTFSNNEWSFAINGTIVPYSIFYDYPNAGQWMTERILIDLRPVEAHAGEIITYTGFDYIISHPELVKLNVTETLSRKIDYIQLIKVPNANGIKFNLKLNFLTATNYYYIEGTKGDSGWTFGEVNGG